MSTMSPLARGRAMLPRGLARPRLTLVPRIAERAPRVPFVILVVLVLGIGLVGLLLVNTALQRGAYELRDLRSQSASLSTREQALQTQVAALRQPRHVAEAAVALGMVRNDSPGFLDLETSRVSGSATPAEASDTPVIAVRPGAAAVHAGKALPAAAGELNGESTGVTRVPRVAAARVTGSSADTQPRSPDAAPAQDRNDSSNVG